MAWVKLDDQIPRSVKHVQAGPDACWFWVCAIAYCSSSLTDGYVNEAMLPLVGAFPRPRALAEQLVSVGLFDRVEGGYQVHDYLHYNDSRETVLAKRRADATRKRAEYSKGANRGEQVDSKDSPRGDRTEKSRTPDTLSSPLRTTPLRTAPSPPTHAVGDLAARASHAESLWAIWREVFPTAPLTATPKEFQALCELAQVCPDIEQFRSVARLLVTSPKLSGLRGLGMLRAKWAELVAWQTEHPGVPFGERPAAAPTSDLAAIVRASLASAQDAPGATQSRGTTTTGLASEITAHISTVADRKGIQ